MAKDPGATLGKARRIAVADTLTAYKDQIGDRDQIDFYRFTLSRSKSLNLALAQLKTNADVALLSNRGKVLTQSRRRGKRSEAIVTALDAGTYYVKVFSNKGAAKTRYRLSLSLGDVLVAENVVKDTRVAIDGSNIAWTGFDGTDEEIFFYNGTTQKTVQLTNDNINQRVAGISGANVVWNSLDSNSQFAEVFFYNGATGSTTQLTNNNRSDQAVGISGTNIVWSGFDGTDSEVFFYNGTTGVTTQLTNNTDNEIVTGISGDNVIWNVVSTSTATSQAFFYSDTTKQTSALIGVNVSGIPIPISLNVALAISGSKVVFTSVASFSLPSTVNLDLFLYDGATGTTTRLTNTATSELAVGISGSNVLWNTIDITNEPVDVFLYNGATQAVTQLTNNSTSDQGVGISGLNATWQGSDGTDTEIFFYDSKTGLTTQLTNNAIADQSAGVSGSNTAWVSYEATLGKLYVTHFAE